MAQADDTRRAAALAASIPTDMRPLVAELAENVLFMRAQLRAMRRDLARQESVIEYDNGGGQEGVRRNPAYAEYHAMLRSYNATLRQLHELVAQADGSEGGAGALASMRQASPLFRVG